jgi:hypothetical protein
MNSLLQSRGRGKAGSIPVKALRRAVLVFGTAALAALTVASPAGATPAITQANQAPAAAVGASFSPVAASFLSPTSGFVLGGVKCVELRPPCSARLAATTTGGAHWRFVGAPDVQLGTAVSEVLFASGRDGWLYGPELWSTHDGGARWRSLSLGGSVVNMAASAGRVYAVVQQDHAAGTPWELFTSPAGRDAWTRIGKITSGPNPEAGPGAGLAVSGRAAWFGSNSNLWAAADGVHWRRIPFRCPGKTFGLFDIAAASSSDVVFLCVGPGIGQGGFRNEVLTSANAGRTVHLAAGGPGGGNQFWLAEPPGRARVISGGGSLNNSVLSRSVNGGKTWENFIVPASDGGPQPLNSLSYVSRTVGWVVVSGIFAPGDLLRTSNAGGTWQKVSF